MTVLEEKKQTIQEVPLDTVIMNPFQPRKTFSQEALFELAYSIEEVGLLHPPLVRPSPLLRGHYELISGERRFRAMEMLGWTSVPVIISQDPKMSSAQAALIENIQRSDLNPLEIAEGFHRLAKDKGWTQEQLADHMGKPRPTVANYLRLLHLPNDLQQAIREGKLSMGHAKALLSLAKPLQEKLFAEILHHGLTVRQAEKRAEELKKGKKTPKPAPDHHIQDLEHHLQHRLGTKVSILHRKKQGSIKIEYFGVDDLERILDLLNLSE